MTEGSEATFGDPRRPDDGALVGRDRWEVRLEEGAPRGDLYELEQETRFHVVDRARGAVVATFAGRFEASFSGEGRWGDERSRGVRRVVVDESGRWAFALHANRMVECFALGDEPAPEDPALPWRLAGLPVPRLPVSADGVTVDEASDLDALAAHVASGWAPEEAAFGHRELPASWLADLYLHLNGLAVGSRLAAAVAAGLEGDDEARRGLALCFYRRVPHAEHRERVLAIVEARGAAEAVRPSPVRYGSSGRLLFAPVDVLAAMLEANGLDPLRMAALRALGAAMLVPAEHVREAHLEALARHAPEWLAEHAPAIVHASPSRLPQLLSQLHRCQP